MKLCRHLVALVLLIVFLVPGSALASRARKPLPPVEYGEAYQNKPIAAGATVWFCFSARVDIVCLLGDSGDEKKRPNQVVDARLPRIVADILNDPQELAGGRIRIPLHGEPYDFQLVGQLAESVMCGSNRSCGVIFAETLAELQTLARRFEGERQAPRAALIADSAPIAVRGN